MVTPIHPPPTRHNKSLQIQTMRGIACILLVGYHIIGAEASQGMRVSDGSVWRFLNEIFVYVRMPVFAFISGYVYALYQIKAEDYPKFYKNKVRRLGMPLLSVSMLVLVISNIVGTAYTKPFSEFYEIYIYSYGYFWYLQASLIIFLVISVMEYFGLLQTRRAVYGLFAASMAALFFIAPLDPNVFSINGALYLFPFFICGMFIKRYDVQFSKKSIYAMAGISGAVLFLVSLHFWSVITIPLSLERETMPFVLFSCLLCVTIYALAIENKFLAWIGGFSYAIYLFHFVQSGMRIGLGKVSAEMPEVIVFFLCLIAGIGIPILIEQVVRRNKYLHFVFLGARLKPKEKKV